MMFRRRSGVSRTTRHTSATSLNLEVLEARQLLAVDLGVQLDAAPAEELLTIADPFARDAVTFEQMASRAAKHAYVPNELLVAIESPAGTQSRDAGLVDWSAELADFEVEPITTIMSFDDTETTTFSLVHLDLGAGADVVEAMQTLDAHDQVLWSSPNFVFEGDDPRDLVPNDPRYGDQYHHPLIGNVEAWDISVGSADIVIGITDDGVDLQHEDLQQAIWVNPGEIAGNGEDDDLNGYIDDVNGYNFLNHNNNPDATGSNDHGTHVAGISAAGLNNGIGTAGTAGGATILPLKWYGGGSWTAAVIAETFTYAADNDADIVNTSYNMDGWASDPVVHAAFDYMYAAGVLHFNSAGNGSTANPARQVFEQTLLVVSTESNDTKSGFSNWGTGVDISAPGGSILSTTPNNTYSTFSGTSMAAPNAAGVAALIWSAHPDWTREQVVARLQGTADNIDSVNPAYAGLLGAGRVNSFQALDSSVALAVPAVENVDGVPPGGSASSANPITGFDIDFNQLMDATSVLDPANYELLDAGPDGMFDTLDDDTIGLTLLTTEYLVGSGGIELDIDGVGALGIGNYRFTIRSGGITNPFGTPLDGDGNGVAGQDYQAVFSVGIEPFVVTGLLGSLGSASTGNPGTLSSAADSDSYPFFAEAGESVAAIIRAGDPDVKLTAEFLGIGSSVTAANPGDDIILPLTEVASDGNVMLSISGDGSSSYQFDIYRNVNFEALIETAGPVDINDSLMQLGSGRFAAVGRSTGSDGGVQFLQSNDASAFIDISGSGTALGLSDDGEATITTAVGNSIFPSGSVTVGNNGVIVAGGGEDITYTNGAIPTSSFGTALLPFWDDIDADSGNVYWEELSVGGIDTLIVQWHNRPHFSNVGSSTFQLQLFESGPLRARYAYQDVDFGDGTYNGGASATIGYQSSSTSGMQYSLNSAVIANGDILDIFALAPTTDVDDFELDLQANERIDVAVAGLTQSAGSETIELLDEGGTVLATASNMPLGISVQNFDQGILGYQVPATGTYTVRVSSDRLFEYTLLITEDLVYDTEANDTIGSANRSLDNVNGAIGYVAGGSQDVYSLTLAADEVVSLATSTPLDHVNTRPGNTLDPRIIVFNDSGLQLAADSNSADGKNASLDFMAPSGGTYYVAVANEGGEGDYVLAVTGDTVVDGDFNDDGAYDCDDIDALIAEITSDATFDDLSYDLTGDGMVDLDDRDAWLAEAATANGLASPYLLGDADLNGIVDGEDFLDWNANKFTFAAEWCKGDFNADGEIDGEDFVLWNANKFQSSAVFAPDVTPDFALATGAERIQDDDLTAVEAKPKAAVALVAPSVRVSTTDAAFARFARSGAKEDHPTSDLEAEFAKLI